MQHFESACLAADASGNLVTDAHLAALAIELGCELASCDTDFAIFPGLRWVNPLQV
jgi:predicted nucleic acid-binding protein